MGYTVIHRQFPLQTWRVAVPNNSAGGSGSKQLAVGDSAATVSSKQRVPLDTVRPELLADEDDLGPIGSWGIAGKKHNSFRSPTIF